MKKCFKCSVDKSLSEYYKHKAMADGHLNKCKQCTKTDVNKHRDENIEKIRAYDRNRPNKKERAEKSSEYQKHGKGREVHLYANMKYKQENPIRCKARNAVSNALRDKRLFRPSYCESCNKDCKPQGHHDDYLKPLSVRWLCARCHADFHKNAREILRDDGIVSGYMLVN